MSLPASNSPSLPEVVEMALDRYMSEVHTCMPGIVVSYDPSKQTAVVQPAFKRKFVGQDAQSMPKLYNVPVIFPAGNGCWIRLPVAAGDPVELRFTERSLDAWLSSGGEVDPGMPHKFNLSDAIATPGLRPPSQAITPKGADSSVEIVNGTAWIEITADGKFKIKNAGAELLTMLNDLITHLISLTTTNAVAGAPCALSLTTIADLTADQAKLALLKAP